MVAPSPCSRFRPRVDRPHASTAGGVGSVVRRSLAGAICLLACAVAPHRPAVAADAPAVPPAPVVVRPTPPRFARSDSDARYLHHIDLYDADNRKITPQSTTPYSPLKTCGRCHDHDAISHGWHFNAFDTAPADQGSPAGRGSEPWIWTDRRIATTLPLSPRGQSGRFRPAAIGLSTFEMIRHFGTRLPGAMVFDESGSNQSGSDQSGSDQSGSDQSGSGATGGQPTSDAASGRWTLTGPLEIDCMICHAVTGTYDDHARRDQIDAENFVFAPTAALRLGAIDGNVSKIKTGSDRADTKVADKLPKVTYDASRFAADGTVHFDLVGQPENNACYQCHGGRTVDQQGVQPEWVHDDDVHIRAGMACVDCHRNGIEHDIVRGFEGQQHLSGISIRTLSCSGCHLGGDARNPEPDLWAGRLGSPRPLHAGLPPLHFEKLACTACHAGPLPTTTASRLLTPLNHALGVKAQRTGAEWPIIQSPVFARLSDSDDPRIHPQRATWPAFFGSLRSAGGETDRSGQAESEQLTPLSPTDVYEATRRVIRVRNDFAEEVLNPKLSKAQRAEAIGADRAAAADEDLTAEENLKLLQRQADLGRDAFDTRIAAALTELTRSLNIDHPVYVSSGRVWELRGDAPDQPGQNDRPGQNDQPGQNVSAGADGLTLLAAVSPTRLDEASLRSIQAVLWPLAHNVRGAGQSLGVGGCTDCHSQQGYLFTSTVVAAGPAPVASVPVTMASLQGVDEDQRLRWNQMFAGRTLFKYLTAASLLITLLVMLRGWIVNRHTVNA